jgi:hypothetical protein
MYLCIRGIDFDTFYDYSIGILELFRQYAIHCCFGFFLLLAEIFTHRCGDKLLSDEKH